MRIRWMTMFLDFPAAEFEAGVDFWSRVTGTEPSGRRGEDGEFLTLVPGVGDAYLRAQRLGTGPARTHLDLHVAEEELRAAFDRAVELGGRLLHEEADLGIVVSPGGYTFCLVPWDGEKTVPPSIEPTGTEGSAARLDQLCLDIPPALWDSECAFWSELTGWQLNPLDGSEFARVRPPAGFAELPVHVLLQRLDDPAPTVTSHPDFAAPQRASLAPAHAALGATVGPANEEWTRMTDPLGHPYCLTGRPA